MGIEEGEKVCDSAKVCKRLTRDKSIIFFSF